MSQPFLLNALSTTPILHRPYIDTVGRNGDAQQSASRQAEESQGRSARPTMFGDDEISFSAVAQAALSGQPIQVGEKPAVNRASDVNSTERTKSTEATSEIRETEQASETSQIGKASKPQPTDESVAMAALSSLSDKELAQVEKLKLRDMEVRSHEQSHLAAAGPHARGGPKYSFQTGPDGKQYAIGGSVSIDASPVPGDPAATIRKAQQIQAAALAPASPSGQDSRVAAAAEKMASEAMSQLAAMQSGSENKPQESGSASGSDVQGVQTDQANRTNQVDQASPNDRSGGSMPGSLAEYMPGQMAGCMTGNMINTTNAASMGNLANAANAVSQSSQTLSSSAPALNASQNTHSAMAAQAYAASESVPGGQTSLSQMATVGARLNALA